MEEPKLNKNNSMRSDRNGGRDRRSTKQERDAPPREIIEMDNEEMSRKLKKNFEQFVQIDKYNHHLKEEEDNEDEEDKKDEPKEDKKPGKPDFGIYRRL